MNRPLTEFELLVHPDISLEDKLLIEETVRIYSDRTDPGDWSNYLRGYLVRLCEELEPDDHFRADIETMAASFNDGWKCCLDFGRAKVRD